MSASGAASTASSHDPVRYKYVNVGNYFLKALQSVRVACIYFGLTIVSKRATSKSTHAAVIFIANADGAGPISRDRYSFASGLTLVS
jgi:hypothetical protein